MKIVLISLLHISLNLALDNNKSKRALDDQNGFYYGVPLTFKIIQQDLAGSPTTNNIRPVILRSVDNLAESKPVTVQQLLYEYQQTPFNAVPNQQFQEPTNQFNAVITPVQHSTLINHNPPINRFPYGNVGTYPLLPHTAPTTPKPYTYYPGSLNYQQARPPNFVNLQQQFRPPPPIPFTPSQPVAPPKQAAPIRETPEVESESEEDEEEDDDDEKPNSRYEDDEEDNSDYQHYKRNNHHSYEDDDDDDDDDNARGFSKQSQSKKNKKRASYKYNKKPKDSYYNKYYKSVDKLSSKDKGYKSRGNIEGRQSQNIPIIQKHNVYQKEKWLITKKN